jgi:DNA-directed RNA polymerase specialized sigma24 family protein
MRKGNKSRHVKKQRKKHISKYRRLYGFSIKEIVELLGWSYGTVHAYFQDANKRRIMLSCAKLEKEILKKGN